MLTTLASNGLNCEYCGQTDLILNHNQDPDIPKHRRATLDHIVPIFAGGNMYAENNWTVACERCNKYKCNDDQIKYKELMEWNK